MSLGLARLIPCRREFGISIVNVTAGPTDWRLANVNLLEIEEFVAGNEAVWIERDDDAIAEALKPPPPKRSANNLFLDNPVETIEAADLGDRLARRRDLKN
jgi:hypothetical protein